MALCLGMLPMVLNDLGKPLMKEVISMAASLVGSGVLVFQQGLKWCCF